MGSRQVELLAAVPVATGHQVELEELGAETPEVFLPLSAPCTNLDFELVVQF